MGIKGVYGELGPGTRTALLKLAVEKKERDHKNFRIAIDFSIWQHQVQLGKGGTNADLRTLFYRSLRLLRLSIEPVFVFDGPHKPPFKRNKKTSQSGGSALQLAAIELFKLLGFPYITAPGEAEAECALLQKEGLVDAVLSEDVDTLMFGCTMHLRSWGAEDPKSKGTATHVDVYTAEEIKARGTGLGREGMILVALMSGGDYLPAGIPNCGIKIACEAARAGFGNDLATIDQKDSVAIRAWRDRLQHELHTNEAKLFRTKHKTLQIPENFPDRAVLYYYTNPVVSTSQQLERYREELQWKTPDVKQFWHASKTFFDWQGIEGLRHYIRNMAPALMGWRLANHAGRSRPRDAEEQYSREQSLAKLISGRRSHSSADGVPELRIAYIPQDIVGLNMEEIMEADREPATHTTEYVVEEDHEDALLSPKKRLAPPYDPTRIEKDWFPECYVRLGVPITVDKWYADLKDPIKFASRTARAKRKEKEAMPHGAIEGYLTKATGKIQVIDAIDLPVTGIHTAAKVHVSSNFHLPVGHNLTSLVTTSSTIASLHQTISRPRSPKTKVAKKNGNLKCYAKVTKPDAENTSGLVSALNEGTSLTKKSVSNMVRKQNSDSRPQFPEDLASNTGRSGKGATHKDALSSFAKSSTQIFLDNPSENNLQGLIPSIEDDINTDRSSSIVLAKAITAPTRKAQFRPRTTYNPWQSLDDFDNSIEEPSTPTKVAPVIVDLTLS